MSYVLDTNTCIFAIKGVPQVVKALRQHSPSALSVSSITLAELWFGARKSRNPSKMRQLQDVFLAPFEVLDFDSDAASAYAIIRHSLEKQGLPIGERDQLIAAVTRSRRRTLVTNNTAELGRVPGLTVTDWLAAPPP